MEESILKTIKKLLNVPIEYDVFDLDLITHINSVFEDLRMLGIGPADGFMIEDDTSLWTSYLDPLLPANAVKSYMGLRVRMLFDPPSTGHHVTAMKEQIEKYEWLLNVRREDVEWTAPTS